MEAYARHDHPETSHEAARRVSPYVNELEKLVVDTLAANPHGLIQTDVARITGRANESITPRFATLVRKGLIRMTGEKRKNHNGMRCNVYVVV